MDEYAKALDQVAEIAKDQKVEAVLLAGDVFDSPAPPPEAEKLVYNFLARLVSERIQCVLIAGNHDHPRKLDALQTLLESLGIHVRHEVRPPDQGGVVKLASRDGSEEARVAVLPFVAERKVVDACLMMDAEQRTYNVFYVPEARGSPHIPAQTDFVVPVGIRSVLGFGGLLPPGDLFAVILFSKVPIPRQTSELFKPLALSAKVAVLPFATGPIFG